jgi:hypothetical protein
VAAFFLALWRWLSRIIGANAHSLRLHQRDAHDPSSLPLTVAFAPAVRQSLGISTSC